MPAKPFRKPGRNRWYVAVELPNDPTTGKRRQRTLTGATRREVVDKQVALLRELATGTSLEPTTLTVGVFLDRWLEEVVKPGRSVRTYEVTESHVRVHLKPALGGILLAKLQPAHVTALLAKIQAAGRSPKTAINVRMTLHTALEHARLKWRLVRENIVDLVDRPLYEPVPADLWSEEELACFLDAVAGRRFEAFYRLALNTGMREAELLGLRWADVDVARGRLSVRRQTIRTLTEGSVEQVPKGKRARNITLTPGTVAVLEARRGRLRAERDAAGAAWRDEGRVFPNGTGGPLARETVYHDWLRTIRRHDLPHMVLHGMRHLHATYLLLEGVHPKIVADRLGHSSTSVTTETYSHVTPNMQREAADAFDRALDRATQRRKPPPDEAAD